MPATTRVVQMEPGPIPTLMASAPASIRAAAASAVAMLPAMRETSGKAALDLADRAQDILAVAVRRVEHQGIHLGLYQLTRPFQYVGGGADGGGAEQPSVLVAGGIRILLPLFQCL